MAGGYPVLVAKNFRAGVLRVREIALLRRLARCPWVAWGDLLVGLDLPDRVSWVSATVTLESL